MTAEEAQRVLGLQSIAVTGYRFQDGTSCCVGCWPVFAKSPAYRGHGFYMTVFRTHDRQVLKRCAACGVPFPGETGQEELDARRITDLHGPSPSRGSFPSTPA